MGFSIHALLAESDYEYRRLWLDYCFSIHALLAESDSCRPAERYGIRFFYPRSPCGERRGRIVHAFLCMFFSIHALLAESDSKSAQNSGALLRI